MRRKPKKEPATRARTRKAVDGASVYDLLWQARNVNQENCKMTCYTCSGDSGITSIIGRCNIDKDDTSIEALGCFDELNAFVGVVATFATSEDTTRLLKLVQDDIHTICAELAAAVGDMPEIKSDHVERIEKIIDDAEKLLEPQASFLFPGGCKEAALLHFARTLTRKAERQLVRLSKTEGLNPYLLKYANRLSSLFHIMARAENKKRGIKEEKPVYRYYNNNSNSTNHDELPILRQ